MSATVSAKLYQTILEREWSKVGICGLLVGSSRDRIDVSAVWCVSAIDVNDFDTIHEDCLTAFPCGQAVVGLIIVVTAKADASIETLGEELHTLIGSYDELLVHLGRESCLLLCVHQTNERPSEISSFTLGTDGPKPALLSWEVETERKTVRMRLRAALPMLVATKSKDCISNQLEVESTRLQTLLQNGSFVFGIDDNQILLVKSGLIQNGSLQKPKSCKDLQANVQLREEERGGAAKGGGGKRKGLTKAPPIPMSMLEMSSSASSNQSYAPVIAHQVGSFDSTTFALPVDVLIEVSEDLPVSKLSALITESVSRQIKSFFNCLKGYTKKGQFHPPEAFHFQPPLIDSPVTVVYPRSIPEQELEKERLILHRKLLLSEDRPYFRKSSSSIFLNPTTPDGYLLNTHIGLPEPTVKSGTVSIVPGYYSYHHYMQDRFNDDKWGCAYRSLQTIVSWFRYQGYTDKSIPSHREIQQALHDVGDKPEKFVGSRQWIGSFEVSFVLDHLLGVSSKFINVNAGAELSTTGQQLARHFQEEGTPVMIGGGVLAHTILGVAYDELTGDINFLILDPHYTGGEDLRTIQSKGWCGWKDMKFWNQTAHYNLCLPQRPTML